MTAIDHITGPPRKRKATKGEADLRLDPQIGFCDPRTLTRNQTMSNDSISAPPRATLGKSTASKPRKAPAAKAPGPDAIADFLAGRDLAIQLIEEGQALSTKPADNLSAKRAHRRGQQQDRFAERYLMELMAQPSLLHGFAAVLSSVLGAQGTVHNAEGFRLPIHEFLQGEVGADGTLSYEDLGMDEPGAEPEPLTVPVPVPVPEGDQWISFIKEIFRQMTSIVELMQREHHGVGLDDFALSGLLPRLEVLGNLGLSAADEDEPISELQWRLYGPAVSIMLKERSRG